MLYYYNYDGCYSSGGTPEARSPLLWSFCVTQSVSNSCAYTWKINPPKKKSRQKQTVETAQKQRHTHTPKANRRTTKKNYAMQTNKIPPNKNQKQNPAK
jgi:hypothetical protein